MALYRIAGFYTELEPKYGRLSSAAEKYRVKSASGPVIRAVLPDTVLKRKTLEFPEMGEENVEYFYTGVLFSYRILDFDSVVLHGSAVSYRGKAYVFSADSGTGKSTHASYWMQTCGKDCGVINDDKPAIRLEDGEYYVYGTPFSGKGTLNENVRIPLGAICFLYRSPVNEIRKISPEEALPLFLKQTLRPNDPSKISKLLGLTDKLLKDVPLYSFGAENDPSSAIFARNAMAGE